MGGGEGASHCKTYGHSAAICAKTAEPIEMPFGLWAGMGTRNHVGPDLPSEGVILTGERDGSW